VQGELTFGQQHVDREDALAEARRVGGTMKSESGVFRPGVSGVSGVSGRTGAGHHQQGVSLVDPEM